MKVVNMSAGKDDRGRTARSGEYSRAITNGRIGIGGKGY
jgi:hypothetical protein